VELLVDISLEPAGQDTPDVGGPRAIPEAVQGMESGARADIDRVRPECGSNAHIGTSSTAGSWSSDPAFAGRVESSWGVY